MSQAKKNLALLGGMVVAAGALGLYAYFGVMKPEEVATEKKVHDEKLVPESGLTFDSLVVTAKNETTALEKKDGQWRITSPVETAADTLTVESLTSQLQSATVKSVVEENPTPADLQKYGLAPPQFSVKAWAKGRELVFEGGVENTFDGSVYLRRKGDPKVYSAPGGLRWTLQKTLFDLRDKRLFAHADSNVKAVQLKSKDNRYTVQRVDDKTWKLTDPVQEDADTGTIQTLLSELKGLQASSFLDDTPARRKETGVDAPDVVLTLTLQDGQTVTLSQATVGSIPSVLKQEGGKTVLVGAGGNNLSSWNKPAAQLKDKSLLKLTREDVAKIVFKPEGTGPELVVQRAKSDAGAEEWELTSPEHAAAQRFKVASALYVLENLKASAPASGPDAKLGLGPSARAVSLFDAQGKLLGRVVLGAAVPDKANVIYARGAKNQVVEVDSTSLSQLPSGPGDLTGAVQAATPG